jgi:heterodisulfide reductase subunit D
MSQHRFTIRQLLEMDACTNCRLCADVCPAACAAMDGELSAVYRMKGSGNLKGRACSQSSWAAVPVRRGAEALRRLWFSVHPCSNCQEVCPLGVGKELWLSLREDLVRESLSVKIDMIRANLARAARVRRGQFRAGGWVEDMRGRGPLHEARAEIIITGCVSAYFRWPSPIATEIMDASGVDFTLLGEEVVLRLPPAEAG